MVKPRLIKDKEENIEHMRKTQSVKKDSNLQTMPAPSRATSLKKMDKLG